MATAFTQLRTLASNAKLLSLAFCLIFLSAVSYSQTTKGYEFWVAEQPNDPTANSPFVIAVANSSATPATVKIYRPDSLGGFVLLETRMVGVGSLEQFSYPSANPFISRVRGAGNIQAASTAYYTSNVYRITSDVKVVAYSFTPLTNVRSNDANLLLPSHALGKKHFLGSYVSFNVNGTFASQVGIVATKPGNTNVKIFDKNGVITDNINLFQGQYFQRLNGNLVANDMTGWYVESDQTIAVFTGNQITAVGTTIGASDHLCEQVLPYETLAKAYVAAPSNSRPVGCVTGNCAPDIFRYVATKNGTILNTSVVLTGKIDNAGTTLTVGPSNPITLNRGQFFEITTNLPHIASATEAFYGYQFLVSQNQTAPLAAQRTGDPSLLVLPVVDQFLYDYTFLFPPAFLYNFLHVVAPANTTFTIDGVVQSPSWKPAGSYKGINYQVAILQLPAGAHKIVGDKKMGIQVVAFETFASYAYLGGSGLEPINAGCITGGPYLKMDCQDKQQQIQLHGFPSCDDGSTAPIITWTSSDGVVFSNPNIDNPVATVPGYGTYEVTMIVQCGNNVTTCTSEIIVREPAAGCASIPISLTPPPDKIVPSDAGQAYATNVNIGTATYVADEPAVLRSDSLTQWPLGTTSVKWTVFDPYGRSASGTHNITVVPPPTIIPPAMIIVPVDPGQTYATVTDLHVSSYWQSPSTYWVYNNFSTPSASGVASASQYSVGDHVITWSVVDEWGRTSSGTQIVRVVPPPPSITPPAMIVVPTDPGQNYATVTSLHDAAYWQSGATYFVYNNYSVPVASGTPSNNQFSVGDNTITWSVKDEYGRTASGTQVVRVVPPPTIVPPAMIIVPTDAGQNHATVNDLHAPGYWQSPSTYWVYNDFSSPGTVVPSGNQYSVGDNTITWSVKDEFGRIASGTQVVRVIPAPSLVPPAMIVVPTDPGQNYATVTSLHDAAYWQSPSTYWVYNNYSTPSSLGVPSGNQFNVGDNTVTWSVKDEFGRIATGTQVVRVVPPPSIVPPAMIIVPTDGGQNYATVNDLHGSGYWQSPSTYWVYNNYATPGATNKPGSDQYNIGDNTINWSVTDEFGRTASGTQIVKVVPPPTIIAPPALNIQNDPGFAYATVNTLHGAAYWQFNGTYWVYNNFSSPSVTNVPAGNKYPLGSSSVTWTVVDQWGRTASGIQDVTVSSAPPTIVPPPAITVTAAAGQTSATISNIGLATYTVSVNPATLSSSAPASNQYPVGTTTVTWTVKDGIGRTASGTQLITVLQPTSCSFVSSITSVPTSSCASTGGVPTNLYIGFGPLSTVLQANVPSTGGACSYVWTGTGLSNKFVKSPVFTPTAAGNYTFTVSITNGNGCTSTSTINICVKDIRVLDNKGQWDGKKVYICHLPPGNPPNVQTISISINALDTHVPNHGGDMLGQCNTICEIAPPPPADTLPTIVAPADITVNNNAGVTYATGVSLGNATWFAMKPATVSNNAPAQYPLGSTTITWTVTDKLGRTASDVQVVTVVSGPPTIVAPPAVTVTIPYTQTYATGVNIGTATYTVSVNPAILSSNAPSQYPVGNTTVTWKVVDGLGRSATATQVITVVKATPPPTGEVTGSQGCTPGYWKNHNEAWGCGYAMNSNFFTVFTGITNKQGFASNYTLGQAVDQNGGGFNAMVRHAVAGLLSACHNNVAYPYTQAQVKTAVVSMFNTGKAALGNKTYTSVDALKDELARGNELGCPLNNSNAVPVARAAAIQVVKLNANVYPNPTNAYFSIQVSSGDRITNVSIRVMDAFGRAVQLINNVPLEKAIIFGEKYASGAYYAEVTQGEQRKVIQLVKAK